MEKKDRHYLIFIGALVVAIIFLSWRIGYIKNSGEKLEEALKKSIIQADSMVKEADGRYTKLVDYYDTESDLKKKLKESNEDLYKIIKKQDERILNLTEAVISLKGQIEEGFGKIDSKDTNLIDLSLKYPMKDANPFITWNGQVHRKTAKYFGQWEFGKLPLQIVVTEEKRGLWKSRLIGPNWLIVDSLQVKSLPPAEYVPTEERNIEFLVGGGLYKSLAVPGQYAISVGGGVVLHKNHNVVINATTNKDVGISYYYKFQSFKRKK